MIVYDGSGTDIDRGIKSADQYGFLTNNMLDTLKLHGNILVSAKRYHAALSNVSKKKYNQTIDIVKNKTVTNRERSLVGMCHRELMAELTRLTGFKTFSTRRVEACTNEESPCLIFERSIKSIGDTDGDQ